MNESTATLITTADRSVKAIGAATTGLAKVVAEVVALGAVVETLSADIQQRSHPVEPTHSTGNSMNKEQIHDEQISPLIREVVAICMKNGISCFINFAIPIPTDPSLQCTTMIPDETGENPIHHLKALDAIGYRP